ncbi:MAG: PLP-dependent aminotransferase family protein [Hyphomicrobiaceae bacterium]
MPAGTLNMSGGFAFGPTIPNISREAEIAARSFRTESLQYSSVLGLPELRDAIAAYVASDGISCMRDEIMVVNGAKHAIDLVARIFLEPGDAVIVTSPTYITAISIFRANEASFLCIPHDLEGMLTDHLEMRLTELEASEAPLPKLLYDVPDFHNPTGVTLSAERRRHLVDLAKRFGFVIIEDDPYRRIRFEGVDVPTIKSFDDAGVVISVGTSSKIVAPGLRLGWVIAARDLIARMAAQKADGGTSAFTQRILVELFRGNRIAAHIDELKETMGAHRDAMLAACARYLPDARIHRPQGGYFLWVELPENIDSDALAAAALERGAGIHSGKVCFATEPASNFLRVCYSFVSPQEIERGISAVGAAFRAVAQARS